MEQTWYPNHPSGCAVMWPNAQPDGSEDSRMVHAGRPPAVGVKWEPQCCQDGPNSFFSWTPTGQVGHNGMLGSFLPDSKNGPKWYVIALLMAA